MPPQFPVNPAPPSRKWLAGVGVAALLAVIGVVVWQATRPQTAAGPAAVTDPASQKVDSSRRDEVRRMAAADKSASERLAAVKATASSADTHSVSPGYGELKPIAAADASPQGKNAIAAVLNGKNPECLSTAFVPEPLNVQRWTSDPEYKKSYLNTGVSGRCWQCAQPSKDIKPIALASPAYVETTQNQPVELSVRAVVGMPVSFSSFDGAHFTAGSGNVGSQLTTQTVVADENGIATAILVAPPGVAADCHVVAACPLNSGLAKFIVNVHVPELEKTTPAINPLPDAPSTN